MIRFFSCTMALLLCAFIVTGCVPVEQAASEEENPWLDLSEYITTSTQESRTTSTSETTTTSDVTTTTTEQTIQIEYPPANKVSAIVSTMKETTTKESTTTTTTTTASPPKDEKSNNSYVPINYDTVYGIWISYLEYSSMLSGSTEKQFRQNFETAVKNSKGLGVNTLYVHVRAHGDAYYKSDLSVGDPCRWCA